MYRTVFSTHRHPASTNPAHPVSVPIRYPSDKSSAVTSFEADIYLHRKCNKIRGKYISGILMRVASGLFSWSMAAGLLAFSSRQFALTIDHEPLSASHYFSFLSKRSGRRMSPAGGSEAPCIFTCYFYTTANTKAVQCCNSLRCVSLATIFLSHSPVGDSSCTTSQQDNSNGAEKALVLLVTPHMLAPQTHLKSEPWSRL